MWTDGRIFTDGFFAKGARQPVASTEDSENDTEGTKNKPRDKSCPELSLFCADESCDRPAKNPDNAPLHRCFGYPLDDSGSQ